MTIDEQVVDFKRDRKAYDAIAKHFDYLYRNYFAHISRSTPISRDEFLGEYHFMLLRSLLKYDPAKAKNADNTFERYFTSALRKHIDTLRRRHVRARKRQMLSLDESRHDIEDERPQAFREQFETIDIICSLVSQATDKKVAALRLMGNTGDDVCDVLKIGSYKYRAAMNRLRHNARLLRSLSSK